MRQPKLGTASPSCRPRLWRYSVRIICAGPGFFFLNDTATPEFSPLPPHTPLPIKPAPRPANPNQPPPNLPQISPPPPPPNPSRVGDRQPPPPYFPATHRFDRRFLPALRSAAL